MSKSESFLDYAKNCLEFREARATEGEVGVVRGQAVRAEAQEAAKSMLRAVDLI